MVEPVDTRDLGSRGFAVRVRIPLRAPGGSEPPKNPREMIYRGWVSDYTGRDENGT